MTLYWRIPISLTLRAPWATPGDTAPGPSTDVKLARNRKGQFILPATLVKGTLLAVVDHLVSEGCVTEGNRQAAFGIASKEQSAAGNANTWTAANEPERAALIFADLTAERQPAKATGRTQRIRIDPEFGAASEGQLLFVECPFDFGDEVTFKGDVILLPTATLTQTEAVRILDLALARAFAFGGMRSVGFGRTIGRTSGFLVSEPVPVTCAKVTPPALELAMVYEIDRPFVIDAERHGGNLFVGSDTLPGGAIKAVLAKGFDLAGLAAPQFLSALSISHATPNGRKVLPLSLSVCDGKLFCHLDGAIRSGQHKFANDWKDGGAKARAILGAGWEDTAVAHSARTRTRIQSDTLTSAYEIGVKGEGAGQLFAQAAVVPDDLVWRGTIRAPDDQENLAIVLGLLAAGLPGFGKTGAILKGMAAEADVDTQIADGDILNLCLTSDACLFAPEQAASTPLPNLYRDYFDDLGFELKNWFARQTLKGGYLALRYPAKAGAYSPWVLTGSGSVFRVRATAKAAGSDILARGLPPAKDLPTDWQKFPFLRENGFGGVINNIVDHTALAAGIAP